MDMTEQYHFGHWGPTSEEILSKQFPLHRACRDGDLETLSSLLVGAQHGIYEEDNFYGWTPAHWASYFGKLNCLMRILEAGLDADVSSIRLNQTPMHIAAFAGRGHCVKWLLHCGAKTDRQDYLGETALHKAARTGSMECISLLVSHGARLYIRNNNNQMAVELSSSCVHQEVTRYLEQAKQCQASDGGGIYTQDPSPHAIKTPSPHDITSTTHNLPQHPCVVNQGLNGGRLPPPGPPGDAPVMDDCPMDEGEADSAPPPAAAAAEGPVTDITTHQGVSANLVAIGGRKRCLEESDEVDHKRRRSDEPEAISSHSASASESPESVETNISSTTVSSVSDRSARSSAAGPLNGAPAGGADCATDAPSGADGNEAYKDVLALSTEPMKCICPAPSPGTHDSNYYVFV